MGFDKTLPDKLTDSEKKKKSLKIGRKRTLNKQQGIRKVLIKNVLVDLQVEAKRN